MRDLPLSRFRQRSSGTDSYGDGSGPHRANSHVIDLTPHCEGAIFEIHPLPHHPKEGAWAPIPLPRDQCV